MSSINSQKVAGAAGILFIVLTLASGFLVEPPPSAHNSAGKFFSYYNDNRNSLLTQGIIASIALIPAFIFAGGLWSLLRKEEGDDGVLGAAAVFAFIALAGVASLATVWTMGIAALADGNGLTEDMARTLGVVSTLVQPGLFSALAPASALSAYVLMRGAAVPRWVPLVGLASAAIGFIAIFGVANDGAFQPFGIFSFAAYLLFCAYVVLVGVFMWLRAEK